MIKGSLVPNITFFYENGDLDKEKTRWHMQWMFDKKVDGLFLTGSYGSGPLMTNQERIQVFEIAKDVAGKYGNKYIIPHVGCVDTKSTIELAKSAESIGVDAIASVPPFYYKYTEELILQFYKDLISTVHIPVYAYNNPETSRFSFTPSTVRKLQDMGLAGIKDSPVEVGFLSTVFYDIKLEKKQFDVILGTSKGWLPYYYMGCRAMIAGMNNYAPEIMSLLTQSTFDGDIATSEKAYMVMMDISAKLHFTDSTIASHMALYSRGYNAGYPRKPMMLPAFDHPKYSEIHSVLQKGFSSLGLPMETGTFKVG
jgi:dihydrodipicolinate synthase/N-acetylneuraminate lyase